MTDREAYIVLNMTSGIGPARVKALAEELGSVSKILGASRKKLLSIRGIGEGLADALLSWEENVDLKKELSMADRGGVEILTQADDSYPSILLEIGDAPLCLYVRGKAPSDSELMLGIVGSRRVTNYGRSMAEHLARSAAYAGWTVVSGLAYGTDAAAHSAVVEAGGRTIAVLGGGLARIFPQDHIPLAKSIIGKGGAVVSEFPMEFNPTRQSFPMRNRIISGLSKGVVVVEAGTTSGALITAKFALEQGRQVFAVPGQADNPQARGCNALIKEGAKLTESFDDVIAEFEFLPGMKAGAAASARKPEDEDGAVRPELTEEESKIADILEKGDSSVDMISSNSGIETGKLLSLLMMMEMRKIIVQLPGKRFSLLR